MFKKALLASAFMIGSLALGNTAKADHGCYRGHGHIHGGHYGIPIRTYSVPVYSSRYHSGYRGGGYGFYGSPYVPSYRSYYRGGLYPRGFGGYPYYGGGTSIGVGRGGISLNFGF